jgi:hypothetical protein
MVGPLLAARALPLRCDASTMPGSALLTRVRYALTRRFSLFLYVTVDVTAAGVSGFEGREVFFEVIWLCNIEMQLG